MEHGKSPQAEQEVGKPLLNDDSTKKNIGRNVEVII